ncbi:MAG: hypothetical protein ACI8P0_004945, partial [Planctomycetaceae bacterium]
RRRFCHSGVWDWDCRTKKYDCHPWLGLVFGSASKLTKRSRAIFVSILNSANLFLHHWANS